MFGLVCTFVVSILVYRHEGKNDEKDTLRNCVCIFELGLYLLYLTCIQNEILLRRS
jgi:hypothetical protein